MHEKDEIVIIIIYNFSISFQLEPIELLIWVIIINCESGINYSGHFTQFSEDLKICIL